MSYPSRDVRSGGDRGRQFQKHGSWNRAGAAPRAPKELFDAVCSDCHKPCKVPFFPSEGRPVQCLDCFRASPPNREDDRPKRFEHDGPRRPFRSDDRGPRGGSDVEARLQSIEQKLNQILELLDADEI